MLSIIIILSIALAIFLGYRTKINTGLFCIVFAYIIGCFVMGLKPKQVIAFWPTNTMFVILSVSLFYNFAAINGTLEKMSGALLYACRNFPGLLPYALFAVAVILSVMGATYFTVLAFLAPITLVICDESRMDKLTGAVAINCGALAGGNFPTSNLGVVFRGLADTAYEASPDIAAVDSFNMEMKIFIFAIIFSLILITIFRFGFKENRNIGKGVTFKKPEAFTKDQKTTLTLMLAMMAVVLIFPLLNILMSGNTAVKYISGTEETHGGTYQAESNRNQRLWYIGTDPGRKCFNGSGFYCNSDQHTGTCDHDNGIPRNFCNGFFLWSQF